MSPIVRRSVLLALSAAAPLAAWSQAEPSTAPIEEVVVFGRAEKLIGVAEAASEGTVGGADLSVRPLLRVAEMLEAVPGLIAAQHSGSGKANQYFLRGFNLDHGTDFTTIVDGMPWNLRSHGHGQGYLDVNGLIPEVVERIDYRKGPYRADSGDFSLAGAAVLATVDRLDERFLSVEGGEYGWRRLAAGGTHALGGGEFTAVAQLKQYDGPWELPEELRHASLWSKYVTDTSAGRLEFSLSGYRGRWHPTEQSPEIAVGTPACPTVYCSLDTTARGRTDRWIATAALSGDRWSASAYAQHYDWRMSSDPTYDFQIDQFDRRWTVGGRLTTLLHDGGSLQVNSGTQLRYDRISRVGLDHTEGGAFVENISADRIAEASIGVWAEATWQATGSLRFTGGLRGDLYHFDVDPLADTGTPWDGGTETSRQGSPKIGAAWAVSRNVELYANWGRGFHSNDARGVVNADTPVPGLVPGTGHEAGLRFELGTLTITAAYWWLDVSSELIFVGDSNAVEPKTGADREGFELVAFWKPLPWLGIDAVYASSRARYKEIQDDPDFVEGDPVLGGLQGRRVEGAVESAGEIGASAVRGAWEASVRLRYLGPYALVPSNMHRADSETTLNLRLAWKPGPLMVYGEVLNLLDDDGKDIQYYYPTFVPGITATGEQITTRLSRVAEPRTLRLGLRYRF